MRPYRVLPFATEVAILTCPACHGHEFREEATQEVFRIDGKYVLVDHIPAIVCARCGEESFSRETTERVRLLVHGPTKPATSIPTEVFEFA